MLFSTASYDLYLRMLFLPRDSYAVVVLVLTTHHCYLYVMLTNSSSSGVLSVTHFTLLLIHLQRVFPQHIQVGGPTSIRAVGGVRVRSTVSISIRQCVGNLQQYMLAAQSAN